MTEQAWWAERYRSGNAGWDRGSCSPALFAWLEQGALSPCRVLVPGCGNGYEVLELARRSFDVVAVDLVRPVVQALRERLDAAGLAGRVVCADVLHWRDERPFDAVYEQTCLCALEPAQWPAYARQLERWLRPGGKLFALFMQTGRDGGPPWDCPPERMRALLPEPR